MRGYVAQMYSIAGWTSMPWLRRLRQPTLVLAGDDDPIVPVVNGRILAGSSLMPGLQVIPGGGHLFVLEQPAAIAEWVTDFLLPRPRVQRPVAPPDSVRATGTPR